MFGYVKIHADTLTEADKQRYQSLYCGLCHRLGTDYGARGRATLTYDMTFLAMVLGSRYQEEEQASRFRCPTNPLRNCNYVESAATQYAADLNVVLAWYKCLDDWQDDGSVVARSKARLLESAAHKAMEQWPRQTQAIGSCLEELSVMEHTGELNPDLPANCFGRLMGELFVWREDEHAPVLRHMGEAMGRFIYLMDAALDLKDDLKQERYNPLVAQPGTDFTPMLTMMMAECTACFETLQLERDVVLIRNILYSGVWVTYQTKTQKGAKKP